MDAYNLFFGPLDKDYCYLFVVFAFIALLTIFVALFGFIAAVLTTKPKNWTNLLLPTVLAILYPGIIYLQNRLLLNMCRQ